MGALFGTTAPESPQTLERMRTLLAHRGRDRHNVLRASPASLGVVAYSHESDCFVHDTGDLQVALAGQLTVALSANDIARLFRTAGLDALHHLLGAYVIAVVDGDTVHLARDGAGGRTVFYAVHEGQLLFASEPKAIHAQPGFARRIRPAALAQYLSFSFVPGSGTMLDGLHELPAGHTVTWQNGQLGEPRRWFVFEGADDDVSQAADERHARTSHEEWVAQTRVAVASAVASRMPPQDDAVAVFLSGGLDSSIIAAEVARQRSAPVRSFAIHFGEQYPNELEHARAVADHVGTEHEDVHIQPKHFVQRLRQMVWHLDEPIGDPITTPNFELSRHVSNVTPWAFNGEGGDPLFGGPKNIGMLLSHWYGGIDARPEVPANRRTSHRIGVATKKSRRLLSPDLLRTKLTYERDLESDAHAILRFAPAGRRS